MRTGPARLQAAALFALLLALGSSVPAHPQQTSETSSLAAFVAGARDAARTYATRDRAIGDGYRAVGVEASAAGDVGGCLIAARAWTGIENPAGLFAWENWALPLAREGLPLSPTFSVAAGGAVALAAGTRALVVSLPPSMRVDAEPVLERWANWAGRATLTGDEGDLYHTPREHPRLASSV